MRWITRRVVVFAAALTIVTGMTVGASAPTASGSTLGGGGDHGHGSSPTRVLIVLFDQMRPEYADRFDMESFQALRDEGRNFRSAYLGYMGSETVITHNVLVSGLLPKNMGWVDEAYRDSKGLLGAAGSMWITGDLTQAQFDTIVADAGYAKLADYLHRTFPGTKFITVGEKGYAVESATAPTGDIAVRMSSRQSDVTPETGCANLGGRWRYPAGKNVPTYLTEPKCGRFYVNSDSANDYGTLTTPPAWMYPTDGNRYQPGTDPEHLGGDVWVADAAMAMMENESWSGMFVTLGGIDKAAHMWGADQDVTGNDCSTGAGQTHVDCSAAIADEQLGRMVDKLESLGQLDETLIVLTADHGATHGASFYGQNVQNGGTTNWYYGSALNGSYLNPSPALAPLIATGNVQFSYQSTGIETWLTDNSLTKKREAAAVMDTLPGVIASYYRDGGRFKLAALNPMSRSEFWWWLRHGQEIVNTMVADSGPDVIALLHDDTSYGVYGDHGGAQEEVQRVPMVFWSDGMRDGSTPAWFRSVDVMPTILRALGISLTEPVDGYGHRL
ncbi:MAG: alkaline phosphatase family protein [Actinomycetota bacterium]